MELLKIDSLRKIYPRHKTVAVDGVSFSIFKGEVLGLVGESGCGKSSIAKSILRLTDAQEGSVLYKGEDLLRMPPKRVQDLRKELQIIFQDPYMSLDPHMKIGKTLEEVFLIHHRFSVRERVSKVIALLEMVGLNEIYLKRFPSELSGGERQRVGIARSIATEPELLICDEPVSSLDISVQAQILNLLMDLQKQRHLTYLFISHDLNVIASICDRVAVMQKGRIVEIGPCESIFMAPQHEYTKAILSAIR